MIHVRLLNASPVSRPWNVRDGIVMLLVASFLVGNASTVFAGKHNRVLDVGDDAPAWEEITGIDGKAYELDKLSEAKAVVVIFTCNHCPVALAYEARIQKLAAELKQQDVALVAINANKGEDLAQMKQHAEERDFSFPYLRDESQKTARAYGATCTPHAFLINAERKIAYMGAIDDNWLKAEEVEADYLREAVQAVVNDKVPEVTETKQVGCAIRWGR